MCHTIDVPYRPFGIDSFPTKHTWCAPCFGVLTPHLSSTSRSSTPFHTEQPWPAAPQLKPIVCAVRFSSFRRFPAHTSVIGISRAGIASRSSIVNVVGLSTRPSTVSVCVAHSHLGTAPWLRT